MTCEISIMNLQAIVLAADSAMTVTRWVAGKEERRFFKGTNKIFQLSERHPVGLMIFGAASLQEVPWELIVKDFRDTLADKSFNDLAGYASQLFDFIRTHAHLFSKDYQDRLFLDEAKKAALFNAFFFGLQDRVKTATDKDERVRAYDALFLERLADLDKASFTPPFQQADLDAALAVYKNELETQLTNSIASGSLDAALQPAQLAELGIKNIIKNYDHFMTSTGVVIAGYGDNDYFPGFVEYRCYGLLLGEFLHRQMDEQKVDIGRVSYIKPFATTDMVRTFLMGFSPDVLGKVEEESTKALTHLGSAIQKELGVATIPNLDQHIAEASQACRDNWTNAAWDAHFRPLTRVVGSLPLDEMAALAETLIMLQSLKEKVTQPTESVGGPIDVAVISKGDGFIWIKRKHYFDPAYNPRFLQRQSERLR